MKKSETKADTTIYLYQVPRLVKTLSLRFNVENADSLIHFQPIDNPYGLSRTTLPCLLVDSCFHQTNIAPQDWDFIKQSRALKNLNIENWIDGKNYGPDNVAAIRAFRVDSIRTENDSLVLQPQKVYIWTDDVEKDAEVDTLQKEQFTNNVVGGLSKWTPFYMMFLLPLFAAMLKLFYKSKRMPYMWHFVHAIHLNTVFLILLCVPLVPLFAYGIDDLLANQQTLNTVQLNSLRITLVGFPLVMFIYMLVSFHTVYRQGWVKTSLKALLFFTLFTLIATLLACALLVWLLATEADTL